MRQFDELERTIQDRQVRYWHEAYYGRLGRKPIREWLGDRLVTAGESIRGRASNPIMPLTDCAARDRPA